MTTTSIRDKPFSQEDLDDIIETVDSLLTNHRYPLMIKVLMSDLKFELRDDFGLEFDEINQLIHTYLDQGREQFIELLNEKTNNEQT